MIFDPLFVAVAVCAVIFAGVSKGGFGSGASFAAAPMLALVIDPALALGLLLPLLMLIDAVSLRGFWRQWDDRSAWALILGSLPGLGAGMILLQVASADALRLLIGAVAVAFVVWQMGRRSGWIRMPDMPFRWGWGLSFGAMAGFASFVSHAGGPLAAVFLLGQGLSKTPYHATTVIVFGVMNLLKVGCYAGMGLLTWSTLTTGLWLAPVAVLGAWLGLKAHHMVPERVFFALTYVVLLGTGGKLIWDGLS